MIFSKNFENFKVLKMMFLTKILIIGGGAPYNSIIFLIKKLLKPANYAV